MAAVFRQVFFVRMTKEKLTVLLSRGIDAVGSLVFLKMLSTFANKSDVGAYLLAASYLAVVLTSSFSAFDQGLLRNVTDYRKYSSLGQRYSALLFTYFCLGIVFSAIGAIALSIFDIGSTLHFVFVPLSVWLAFEAIKNLNITVASGMRSRRLIAVASAVDYCARITLLWVAYALGLISTGIILYLLAAAGLAASCVFLYGQRKLLSRFSWVDARDTLVDSIKFSWPMIIWGFFGWLQNMSNRWMLNQFSDLQSVAEYGVLVAIGTFPVTALLGLVVTYVVPILYERESNGVGSSRTIVRRVAFALIPACGLFVLIVSLWHREITIFLSSKNYAEHSNVLPFIMAAACASATCSVLTYAVYAQRRVASLLLANTIPGAFSLVFGYFMVRHYQFDGAVLTLVLSHVLAAMLFVATFLSVAPRSSGVQCT
jgi:O-antigen/teichoic acid export membrane protein